MTSRERPEGASGSLPQQEAVAAKAWRRRVLRAIVRGLVVALVSVIALTAVGAIWGAIWGWHPGATIFGTAPPGWDGAYITAIFWLFFLGPPAALVGFGAGFAWSFFLSAPGRTRAGGGRAND